MDRKIEKICRKFGINGEYMSYELLTNGHINTTYKVYFVRHGEVKDYVLQRINVYVFKNPEAVMENIVKVTEYIRDKIKATGVSAKRYVLHYQPNEDGKYYFVDEQGGFWRCARFIDDSVTFNITDNPTVIEEAGKAFGEFQMYLADFPVKELNIVIPHFHNTVLRYETFENSIKRNDAGRADEVKDEISKYLSLKEIATKMYKMQRAGELPLKVTHNDTKCNNVLFDKTTFRHLSVIDLDTVMPGLVGFDFGDAVRFTANTCDEDEKDVSAVKLDMNKFEAFTRGFLSAVGSTLSENEKNTLALGAVTMTIECGMRFLTDYLDGDKYFKICRKEQNLDRARCQLALAENMISRLDEMNAVVDKYCKQTVCQPRII